MMETYVAPVFRPAPGSDQQDGGEKMIMKHIFLATIFIFASIGAAAQPSANEIVFHGYAPGTRSQIYSIRADGSGQVNLTNDPTATYASPGWSPDGTKIIYTRNNYIWVMNADGSNKMQLTFGVGGITFPVWSPDGSKIAYVFDGHGFEPSSIVVMNSDGSNHRQLTWSSSYDIHFNRIDWSPDSNKIVFSRRGNSEDIYVINVDGTGQTNITNAGFQESNTHPKWSPDGSKIAFAYYYDLLTAPAVICIMNANGSNRACITDEFTRDDYYPSWSSDGLRLAFSGYSYDDGYSQIYVMNADGTNLVQVTQNGLNYFAPNWKRAAPSAQHQLSGRVTTSSQRGIPRAVVTLDDGAGNLRFVTTNPFGYFRFADVPTGTYTVSVSSKSYSFTPRTISVSSSITGLDFVALNNP